MSGAIPYGFARGAIIALVKKSYVIDGRPVVDCLDPATGRYWERVPVALAGGGRSSYTFTRPEDDETGSMARDPDQTDGAQAILLPREGHGGPVAIGILPHVGMELVEAPPPVGGKEVDPDGIHRLTDTGIRAGDARLFFDADGNLNVVLPAERAVRLLLGAGGGVRVALGDADGRLPLAAPLEAHLQNIRNYLADIASAITTLEVWAVADIAARVSVGIPAAGFTPHVPTTTNPTHSALRSATFRVPAATEG